MDYLARESADLSDGLWNRIDETVIGTARAQLTCRRFLKVFVLASERCETFHH